MCDTCLAALEVADATRHIYRRALTQVELEHGDVDRVRDDMDASEQGVVKAGAPVIRDIVAQLVDELRPLVEAGDVVGVARVKPSYTGKLAKALKAASDAAVRRGKRQVLDQAKSKGTRLAKRPTKDPKKALEYLAARADAMAEQIQSQIDASIKRTVLAGAATATWTDELATAIQDSASRALVASAYDVGRESFAVGRLFGYQEVKDDIAEVVYTAILDDAVCEVCLDADGRTWNAEAGDDLDEGFDSAPNPECYGGESRCRCWIILVHADNR